MDIFDLDDERRRLQQAKKGLIEEKAPGIWEHFCESGIRPLLRKLNSTKEATDFPAEIKGDGHDTSLMIERVDGLANDQFHTVTITIHIIYERSHHVITADRKKWLLHSGVVKKMDDEKKYEFKIEGDPKSRTTWLVRNDEHLTPYEAAELVIREAFLADI